MKAIVMAGGSGVRLRPLSLHRPKPMVPLFGKPVLEHIISLLKKNNFTDICITLRYLPRAVTDYFGNGEQFGVNLSYRTETEPLGTAGSVKACSDFLNGEDFLVISGDAVCDFDLKRLVDFHYAHNCDAALALYAHPEPLEYGLVMTGTDGRVVRFAEKPDWNRVFTDLVNTGIYTVSGKLLSEIPENTNFDFAKDLFPALLQKNAGIYGLHMSGYWCDIGSTGSYLHCMHDALNGKVKLDLKFSDSGRGVYSGSELPHGVFITPPCYIGKDVIIGEGTQIGPNTVLGSGSMIGKNCVIQNSFVDSASIGDRSSLHSSIVCRGTSVGCDSLVCESSVIAEDCRIGSGTLIGESVKIWPGKAVENGSSVSSNIIDGMSSSGFSFKNGTIEGDAATFISPELLFSLGMASGKYGKVGLSCIESSFSEMLLDAFSCGVRSSGGDAAVFEASFPAEAAFASCFFEFPLCVYISNHDSKAKISFFDKTGLPISRSMEKDIEKAVLTEFSRVPPYSSGSKLLFGKLSETYLHCAAMSARYASSSALSIPVWVAGSDPAAIRLKTLLKRLGCRLSPDGGIKIFLSSDGMDIEIEDEYGKMIDKNNLLAILAYLEFKYGSGEIAAVYTAPAVLELIAESFCGKVLRLGRDGSAAENLFSRQVFTHDAVFAAARLCCGMGVSGESLHSLHDKIPDFFIARCEVPVHSGKALVMKKLSSYCSESSAELISGIKLTNSKGCAHIYPDDGGSLLRICAESFSEEYARELCSGFESLAKQADKQP